jgi:hypothetical protein
MADTQEQNERNLKGLENLFREVVVNSGTVYVTVDGQQIKTVKRDLVDKFGPRRNKRTDVEKQANDLILRRVREMFGLQGQHLGLKFLQLAGGKLQDERGKDVIRFVPTEAK